MLFTVTLGGIAFLTVYGAMSLKSAFASPGQKEQQQEVMARGRRAVILGALAVTVLNPHLYLDTVVILGSIGGLVAAMMFFIAAHLAYGLWESYLG